MRQNCSANWSLSILFNQATLELLHAVLRKPFSARHRALQKLHRYIPVRCMITSLVLVIRQAVSA